MTITRPPRSHSWKDVFWKGTAAVLAVAFAVSFTLGQIRGTGTHAQASTAATQAGTAATQATAAAHSLKVETQYLADLADYANYLALTLNTICGAEHLTCPAAPHFPDPLGLPALGLP